MTYFEVVGDDITQLGQTIFGVAREFSNQNDFKEYALSSKDVFNRWRLFLWAFAVVLEQPQKPREKDALY